MDKKQLKTEALFRMEYLGLAEECIHDFKVNDAVWQSENGGFLYTVSKDIQDKIDEAEKEYGGMVYHVILSHALVNGEKMEMYSFLYVSPYEESWEDAHFDLESGIVFTYVYNETVPEYSELGNICVAPQIGGLVRTMQTFDYKAYNEGKHDA